MFNDSLISHAQFVLASGSPRRRELLEQAGYRFRIVVPAAAAECGVCSRESPREFVARLARQKAKDVGDRIRKGLVLAADTVAECQGQVLGKPASEHHAREMLTLLRGRIHYVHTGVCLWQFPGEQFLTRVRTTKLRMDEVSDSQLDEYLASGGWAGKAGAFGYQDRLGWIHIVEGSESNVVGLPMETVAAMFQQFDAST